MAELRRCGVPKKEAAQAVAKEAGVSPLMVHRAVTLTGHLLEASP